MRKILVGGSFNIIHKGHEFFLRKAKSYGDYLVVVIASDSMVSRKGRPVTPVLKRKKAVESLGIADKVLIGSESMNIEGVLEREKPNLVVLGPGQSWLKRKINKKAETLLIRERLPGYSTRKILGKG